MRNPIAIRLLTISLFMMVSSAPRGYAGRIGDLPVCGQMPNATNGRAADGVPRLCGSPIDRTYVPKYVGIGYEILREESDACFVPDELFRLLDELEDEAKRRIVPLPENATTPTKIAYVRNVSSTIGTILNERNFGIFVPTETLVACNALTFRNVLGSPERHVYDCDAGSFIYLTIAENLGFSASLIEIYLRSGALHYYVEWPIEPDVKVDWDANGQTECVTPSNLVSFQGRPMSRSHVLGYAKDLRAALFDRLRKPALAINDYHASIKLYPETPHARNNLAWIVATQQFSGRETLHDEALRLAQDAVKLVRNANNLDILACTFALNGRFHEAIKTQEDASALEEKPDFRTRLERFKVKKDCTGFK